MREILVRKIVNFDTNFFFSIMFELGCTKFRIFQEAIVDPVKKLLDSIYGLDDILSLKEFSHICGQEVVPSQSRSLELREGPVFFG